ncbi:MAG: shikimate kinase AroK [Gammaproteobacteria bacterium]
MTNVFLIGSMGAGKTTVGRVLADQLNFEFYDSDEIIEARAGADIAWIFDVEGEAGFRQREQRIIEEITQKNNIVLATGGGVVLIPQNRTLLAGRGFVVYLRISLQQQLERLRYDSKRPLLNQKDKIEDILTKLHDHRDPIYSKLADLTLDTENLPLKMTVKQIIQAIPGGPAS